MKLISLSIIPVFLLSFFIASADNRQPTKDVRDVLSSNQFKAAGLQKLSEEEILSLSGSLFGWVEPKIEIQDKKKHPQANKTESKKVVSMKAESNFGNERIVEKKQIEKMKELPKSIVSSLSGEFKGWSGKTKFVLDNGQVWKQTDGKRFVAKAINPRVEIKKGMLGAYFLKVEGYGSRCKVERIK